MGLNKGLNRYVNTKFWGDPWILDLSPKEKLVFLYLLTNDRTNMLGVYELGLKVTEFELGIPRNEFEPILQKFEKEGKIIFRFEYIVIINWIKHQSCNTNMLKSAFTTFDNLRSDIKEMIPEEVIIRFQNKKPEW